MMIISKRKKQKFDQKSYDTFFRNIEYNLREMGFGDVTVNKKMKELNKILYDILLKLEKPNKSGFSLNDILISKYFKDLNKKDDKYSEFERYFVNFYDFCFELSLDNMIREAIKFK